MKKFGFWPIFSWIIILIIVFLSGIGLGQNIFSEDSPDVPFSPENIITTEISRKELQTFLIDALDKDVDLNYLLDNIFFIPRLEDFKEFLSADNTNFFQFQEEWFDCEDFCFILKGRAAENGIFLGMIDVKNKGSGLKHRLNLLITKDEGELEAFFVMPQTDEICPIENKKDIDEIVPIMF